MQTPCLTGVFYGEFVQKRRILCNKCEKQQQTVPLYKPRGLGTE